MKRSTTRTVLGGFLIAIAVATVFIWICAGIVLSLGADAGCVSHGYRESNITWNLHRYCVVRVDQTDRVVPYGYAMKHPVGIR